MAGKTPFLKGSAMVLGIPFGTSLNMLPTSSNPNPTTDEQKSTNSESFNSETLMVQPQASPKKSWTAALMNSWKWNDEDIDQNTMDQMMEQREDLDKHTTNQTDQKDQKWNQFFQKTCWNKYTSLGESWKWNDEDIDQNTMDQMIKQREDVDQNDQNIMNQIKHHNFDHESAWEEIMKWESRHANKEDGSTDSKMHSSECKATEYSPKARFGALIGFKPPFDRHDCVIDRDGKEVRYVVDYYHDKDPSNPDAAKIDVRPALDSLDAFQDRMKFAWGRWSNHGPSQDLKPMVPDPTKSQT